MNNFIQNSIYNHNWVVPRSVMCTLFWTGVILVFTGMILLVTSKHKGKMYESWGGVLLGLGLCILLVCLILCVHAYCVMAADAADEEGIADAAAPDTKTNPYSSDGRSATAASNPQQDPYTGGFYPDASLINGRKPRSIAELIPPPKFGVNVSKPPTHTVRFFLSDNVIDEADEAGSVEIGLDEEKTTKPNAETALETDRQKTQMKYPHPTQTHNGVRKISPSVGQGRSSNESSLDVGYFASDPGKTNSVDQRMNADNRSLDRNIISSDCDSLMSVETIIPRTLQRDPGEQMRRPSAYDFPDDIQAVDDSVEMEVSKGRSSPIAVKSISKPFPVSSHTSHSLSSTTKGGSQGKTLPVSRQTPRHSHKLQQSHQPYSSEASPSPVSPELTESLQVRDRGSTGAEHTYTRQSTVKPLAIPVVKPTTPASHHRHNPEPALGGLSITRSFGPSSVTVTPLGTTHDASRPASHRRHTDDTRHGHGRPEEAYQRHPHGSKPVHEEEELDDRTMMRDAGTTWTSAKQEQKQHPSYLTSDDLPLSNRYQQMPRPPSNSGLLEITESKATVYDNVQYFQM